MVINTIEFRWMRQLRSASTMPAPSELASLDAVVVLTWRKVSPSAWLMVDPRNGARAVIRDTRSDAARFLWSALAAGEMDLCQKVALMISHKPSRFPRQLSVPTPESIRGIQRAYRQCEAAVGLLQA
jgi:hypothetical protein